MKKLFTLMVVVVAVATACQKDVTMNNISNDKESVELSATRSYDEALKIAEDALTLLDGDDTRATKRRVIKRTEGQTVMRSVTRGSEAAEEPIMYIFNNENDEGFTIVAANRSVDPVIAVTEKGNYTYGEPTGVEPFDLLMEDVAISLAFIPDVPMAIMDVEENIKDYETLPTYYIEWGTEGVYGSMFPDNVAHVEGAAIAQTLMNVACDSSYQISIPGNPQYGTSVNMNKAFMAIHRRNDHVLAPGYGCDTVAVHNQIATLYREIGQRLISGTSVSITNKRRPFDITKIKTILDGFGCEVGSITSHSDTPMVPMYNAAADDYYADTFVIQGSSLSDEPMPNQTYQHTWIASRSRVHRYDKVTYGLNQFYNPSAADPNGYTELAREVKYNYMFYFNWGFDGISNGWFNRDCFDMSQRVGEYNSLIDIQEVYDYNFDEINYFMVQKLQ